MSPTTNFFKTNKNNKKYIWHFKTDKQMCSIRGQRIHDGFNKIKHFVSSRMFQLSAEKG